jgi:hypothetical protein
MSDSGTDDTDPPAAIGSSPAAHPASVPHARPVTVLGHEVAQARRRVDKLRDKVLADQERNERTTAELRARIREAEQARDAARAAEREALIAAARIQGALDVRERELAGARIEAAGATDVIAKLQRELGAAHANIAALEHELQDERVGLGTAQALLAREREQHAAALRQAEARAHAALSAEQEARRGELEIQRATVAQERETFEQRLAAVHTQAGVQLAALRADVAERDGAVVMLEGELEAGRRRADATEEELGRRDALMARVTGVAHELRSGLDEVRTQLDAERGERTRTDETATRVLVAAASLLRRSKQASEAPDGTADGDSQRAEAAMPTAGAGAGRKPAASVAAPPAGLRAGHSRGGGNLNELLDRFDQIRGELADQGIGTPPPPRAKADDAR